MRGHGELQCGACQQCDDNMVVTCVRAVVPVGIQSISVPAVPGMGWRPFHLLGQHPSPVKAHQNGQVIEFGDQNSWLTID
jgi:hypothetical protein